MDEKTRQGAVSSAIAKDKAELIEIRERQGDVAFVEALRARFPGGPNLDALDRELGLPTRGAK